MKIYKLISSVVCLIATAVAHATGINDALDCHNLAFETGGNAPWFVQTSNTASTAFAMQTGRIAGNEVSWLRTEVSRPGTLTFKWKASCEKKWDKLFFQFNDVELAEIYGNSEDWTVVTCAVETAGTFTWKFKKDGSTDKYNDCAWLDCVTWMAPVGVSFNGNGGDVGQTDVTYYQGYEYGVFPTAVREYHDFIGWYTDADAGLQVVPTDLVGGDDIVLYAHWHHRTYTVQFDIGEYGEHTGGGALIQTIGEGEAAIAPLVSGDASGRDFLGWDIDFSSVTQDIIVRAVYQVKQIEVTINSAHGDLSGAYQFDWGDIVNLTAPHEIVDGGTKYVCRGWTTTADDFSGTGNEVSFAAKENLTLTWLWDTYDYVNVTVSGFGTTSCVSDWILRGRKLNINGVPATAPLERESLLSGWKVNGEFIRNSGIDTGSCEVVVSQPMSIEAVFETYAHFYKPRVSGTFENPVVLPSGVVLIDTDETPSIKTGNGELIKSGNVENGVARFEFSSLTIESACDVRITGSRPLLIASTGDMKIDAAFKLMDGVCGAGIGGPSQTNVGAGGRGGYGTSGGSGGAGGRGGEYGNGTSGRTGVSGDDGRDGEAGIDGVDGMGGNESLPGYRNNTIANGGPAGVFGGKGTKVRGGYGGSGGQGSSAGTSYSGGNGENGWSGVYGVNGMSGGSGGNGDAGENTSSELAYSFSGGTGGGSGGAGGGGGGASSGSGGGGGGGGGGGRMYTDYREGGNGGNGGTGGSGGNGGTGGDGGAGGHGAYGGGILILSASGVLSVGSNTVIDVSQNGQGIGHPGCVGGNGRSGSSGSAGTSGSLDSDGKSMCKGGNGGTGGRGGTGGSGGDGGRGGDGGYGAPGTVKLCASVILAEGSTIIATNGNNDVTDNRLGRVSLISNMTRVALEVQQPIMDGRPLIGYLHNNGILRDVAPYDTSVQIPLLGQLVGERALVSGIIATGNYAWSQLQDDDLTDETDDARLWQLYGFYEGYEQLFVENKTSCDIRLALLLDEETVIRVPEIPAGEIWTICVPKGADVKIIDAEPLPSCPIELTPLQATSWVSEDLAPRYAKSGESAADYQNRFEAKFGADPVAAMSMPTDKKDAHGNNMYVWQDYVAGTDPTDTNSVFTATITMVDGEPVVEWSPKLSAVEEAKRTYTIYGKTSLESGEAWHSPTNSSSRFFRVGVEMK